jgi:hypothetical protein
MTLSTRNIAAALVLLSGCGLHSQAYVASNCTTKQTLTGAEVSCTDGTHSTITNGSNGAAGSPGVSCSVAPVVGGVKLSCPDGSTQTLLNGVNGQNGNNGNNGIDGTVITSIKFCPNIPDTYPSSFPEYGVCMNNQLYAVYWNGSQAFLALLTPGNYSSTSPQGCSFHVVSGCSITN